MSELPSTAGLAATHPVVGVRAADAERIRSYYDEHIVNKIADFVDGNPRVDAAWRTVREWAPASPRHILDIGCGFGQMCWQMAGRWERARVTGIDISPRSIELAATVFDRPNLSYATTTLEDLDAREGFDLITLIDVYEHIAAGERGGFNAAIARVLSSDGVIVLTFPTPAYQRSLRAEHPEKLQPVDEDVDLAALQALAAATGTRLVLFAEQSIWLSGDYAHAVLTRASTGRTVPRVSPAPMTVIERARRKLRAIWRGPRPGSREGRLARIERALGPGVYQPRWRP